MPRFLPPKVVVKIKPRDQLSWLAQDCRASLGCWTCNANTGKVLGKLGSAGHLREKQAISGKALKTMGAQQILAADTSDPALNVTIAKVIAPLTLEVWD